MQKAIDSQIQAKVRILLAKKWVDLKPLTIGTTNGVVYIGGSLQLLGGPSRGGDPSDTAWQDSYVQKLSREIGEIPEVHDVVFRFGDQKRAVGQ